MLKTILRLSVVQFLVIGLQLCCVLSAQGPDKPLTNADIIKMVKAGVRESVIVSSIQTTPPKYDLSPPAASSLRRAGVTQKMLDAMAAASRSAAPAAAETPTSGPASQSAFRR